MNRPVGIQQLMGKKKSNIFVNIAYSLMSNLNMSFDEVKKLPIPTAIVFMGKLKEEQEEMNRGRRKHTH